MNKDPFVEIPSLKDLLRFGGSRANDQMAETHGKLTEAGMTRILELCEALWIYPGEPNANIPHAELTYGKWG